MSLVENGPAELPTEPWVRRAMLSLVKKAKSASRKLRRAPARRGAVGDAALHDFRVAVRRLRSWLRDFRPQLEDAVPRGTRRRLRAIAQASSAARDLDVQLSSLEAQRRKLTPRQRVGLRWLTNDLTRRRRRARAEATDAARHMKTVAEELEKEREGDRPHRSRKKHEAADLLGATLASLLRSGGRSLQARLALIHSIRDELEVHRARIAAKRLRYLAEQIRDHWPDEDLASLVKELEALQDLLGTVHDAHTLMARLHHASSGLPATAPRGSEADARRSAIRAVRRRLDASAAATFKDVDSQWLRERGAPFFGRLEKFADTLVK